MQNDNNLKNNNKTQSTLEIVKEVLAEKIGVEPTDIELEDTFRNDLHMSATNLSDFVKSLEKRKINIEKIDLTQILTVKDLVETIDSNVLLE